MKPLVPALLATLRANSGGVILLAALIAALLVNTDAPVAAQSPPSGVRRDSRPLAPEDDPARRGYRHPGEPSFRQALQSPASFRAAPRPRSVPRVARRGEPSAPHAALEPVPVELSPEAAPSASDDDGLVEGPGCDCDECRDWCDWDDRCWDEHFWLRRLSHVWDNFEVFGGVHAYKGPVDQGQNGNFGFHEGVNFGLPLSYIRQIGGQIGIRGTHSAFSGTSISPDERNQVFVTMGLFRRTEWGMQYGAAVDFLDDRYYVDMNLSQIRGELSWVFRGGNEIGVWVAGSSDSDDATFTPPAGGAVQTNVWEPTEQFALFLRRQLSTCGEARVWGGGTSSQEGIFGGELYVPVSSSLSVSAIFNYKIPDDGTGNGNGNQATTGHVDEAWSVGVSLVWYPGRRSKDQVCDPFRPLFNVADNATFMVDRLRD